MTRTSLSRYPCPLARAADVMADQWAMLILRDALAGVRRFSDFKARLGVSTNILTKRLNALVEHGVLEARAIRPGVTRVEYQLTEKGFDLVPALIALMQWGERWAFEPGQSPVRVQVRETGEGLGPVSFQTESGRPVRLEELELRSTQAAPDITRRAYAELEAKTKTSTGEVGS